MDLKKNRTVNLAVQVLPFVDDVYGVVDRAIAVIAKSGIRYEVGPLETVLEGPLDEALKVAKAAHLACFDAGANEVVTIIKIADRVQGASIDEKVGKYR